MGIIFWPVDVHNKGVFLFDSDFVVSPPLCCDQYAALEYAFMSFYKYFRLGRHQIKQNKTGALLSKCAKTQAVCLFPPAGLVQ